MPNSVWMSNRRPKGRPAKVPREKVVALINQGKSNYEISQEVGLCLSRVRSIRAQGKAKEGKQANPEFVFGRIVESDSEIQTRIREYCRGLGVDNRCTVRQATEEERREFGI